MFIFEKNPKNLQKPIEYTLPDGTVIDWWSHDTRTILNLASWHQQNMTLVIFIFFIIFEYSLLFFKNDMENSSKTRNISNWKKVFRRFFYSIPTLDDHF